MEQESNKALSHADTASRIIGKIFVSLFFAAFLAAGLFFTWVLVRQSIKNIKTHYWQETICSIISSEIVETKNEESPYRLNIHYKYKIAEQEHESSNFTTNDKTSSDYSKLDQLLKTYSKNKQVACYYNPKNPLESVIEKGNWSLVFTIFLPLIFILVGAIGIGATWFSEPAAQVWPSTRAEDETAENSLDNLSPYIFLLFAFIGGGIFYAFVLDSFQDYLSSKNWEEKTCKVISSNVREVSNDEATSYKVDIVYEYKVGDQTFRSNRYSFLESSSGEYKDARRIVQQNSKNSLIDCYVDPNNPSKSVLTKGVSTAFLLSLIIPSVFVLVGLIGFLSKREKK